MGDLAAGRGAVPDAAPQRRGTRMIAGLAAAAALAAGAWLALDRDGRAAPATPTRWATGDAPLSATWGDADLVLEPGGAMTATGDAARGAVIVLERGAAVFDVAPRAGRPAFTVVAGDVRVEVVGTQFRVERRGESATVSVSEGVVRVIHADVETSTAAGGRWPPQPTETRPQPDVPPPVVDRPPPAASRQPPTDSRQPPSASRPPSSASRQPSSASRQPTTASRPPTTAGRPPTTAGREPPATRPSPSPSERYAQAAGLERRDAAAAFAIYSELATRTDGWGATALYALGRLHADRHDPSAAARHLRAYLARFPTGPNVDDARALLDRIDR